MKGGAVLPYMNRSAYARRVERRAYFEAVASGFAAGVAVTICAGILGFALVAHAAGLSGHVARASAPAPVEAGRSI